MLRVDAVQVFSLVPLICLLREKAELHSLSAHLVDGFPDRRGHALEVFRVDLFAGEDRLKRFRFLDFDFGIFQAGKDRLSFLGHCRLFKAALAVSLDVFGIEAVSVDQTSAS